VIELRSYRRVFELERRIYRVDRLRLNPAGVPVRGIVYFLALVVVGLLAAAMPLAGTVARVVPWYARALVLPGLGAAVLALISVEGRSFHLTARALLRYALEPRRTAGLRRRTSVGTRWSPGELLLLPDGSDAHLRRLRYSGPGAVLVTVAHERSAASGAARLWTRRSLAVRELDGAERPRRGRVLVLDLGASLRTDGAASRGVAGQARWPCRARRRERPAATSSG
jgi:hypothetical protein